MVSLYNKGLLTKGDYFVVGVDIEQYDASKPDKYMRGILMEKSDGVAEKAFRSYLGIFPTASVAFGEFAKEVTLFEKNVTDRTHTNTNYTLDIVQKFISKSFVF